MGILDDGLFGGFRGKAGPLVGRKVNGQSVICAAYRKRGRINRDSLPSQLRSITMMVTFLSPLKELIAMGFRKYKKHQTAFSAAVSYNLTHAIRYNGTVPYIEYPKLCFSKGTVMTNLAMAFLSDPGEYLAFSWCDDGQCNQMDLATFLIYDEEADFFYVIVDAARRHEHMFFLDAPPNTLGHKLHGYMSYTAAEGKAQSDTMYAGWAIVEP